MNKDVWASVRVTYKHVDGWHVFTSPDLPGLYIASNDPEKAFRDVSKGIEALLKADEGIECVCVPEMSLAEFLRTFKSKRPAEGARIFRPRLSERQFAVYANA